MWLITRGSSRSEQSTSAAESLRRCCFEIVAEWLDVLSGVPQGSVLGPLLFIIFINDLSEILIHFVKLFADDGKLIAAITEEELRVNQFQKDIKSLEKWCDEWSMCLNVKKCKILTVFFFVKNNNMGHAMVLFLN